MPERRTGIDPDSAAADDAGIGSARLRFDPPAPADATTPITRLVVDFTQALSEPQVLLVTGALTTSQIRDLARPTLPQTLSDRAVSALAWTDQEPRELVVAPLVTLEPGALYTIGVSAPPTALAFTVGAGGAEPTLVRIWPDRDETAPLARAAVWCGSLDLELPDTPVVFAPAGVAGRFAVGTGAPIAASKCASWFARADGPAARADSGRSPAVAPASVVLADGSRVLLEPTLLWDAPMMDTTAVATCDPALQAFGPGCAEVEDDRLVVQPPVEPLLWTIDAGQGAAVRATRGAKKFVVRPMPLDATYQVATLDRAGRVAFERVPVTPGLPRAHLVINEVMANPAGSEPAQEWIELCNDGQETVSLAGFSIDDVGGHAILPDATIEAGGFALIVAETFVQDDGVDPVPLPNTLIVRVPMLGKGGLSNDGEPFVLRDPAGGVVSTFPAVKTKNGVSVARVAPDALDDDLASFEMSQNGKGTPGGANRGP